MTEVVRVHILHEGRPLCGFSTAVPGEWPASHKWIRNTLADVENTITCPTHGVRLCEGCLSSSGLLAVVLADREMARNIEEVKVELKVERERARSRIPDHVPNSLDLYVQHGIPTGDSLRAILANDLEGAFGRADPQVAASMRDIVAYVRLAVPHAARGSYQAVDAWESAARAKRRQEVIRSEIFADPLVVPAITCPRCGMTSHNRNDVREGYCGACHDWTRAPT